MKTKTQTKIRPHFLPGYWFKQTCEVADARRLFDAIVVTIGEQAARKIAKQDPGRLFRRLRYGRNLFVVGGLKTSNLLIDWKGLSANKATTEHILTPGHEEWRRFVDRVRNIQRRKDYPYSEATLAESHTGPEFFATAKALDEMGFAVAESIAVLMLFRGLDDDSVVCRAKLVWNDNDNHEIISPSGPAY